MTGAERARRDRLAVRAALMYDAGALAEDPDQRTHPERLRDLGLQVADLNREERRDAVRRGLEVLAWQP